MTAWSDRLRAASSRALLYKIRKYVLWPIHYVAGYIAGFLWFIDHLLSVFLYVQFLAYEYVEEEKVHDQMYYELREFTAGFVLGFLSYMVIIYLLY